MDRGTCDWLHVTATVSGDGDFVVVVFNQTWEVFACSVICPETNLAITYNFQLSWIEELVTVCMFLQQSVVVILNHCGVICDRTSMESSILHGHGCSGVNWTCIV